MKRLGFSWVRCLLWNAGYFVFSWMRRLRWGAVVAPAARLGREASACGREPLNLTNEANARTETLTAPVVEMPIPTLAEPSSACPPALVRLAQRMIAESNARVSRLSRLRDRPTLDDGARRQLHEETLLLLSQVQHVQHVFAGFNVEFATRTKENEGALFYVEPVLVIDDAPIPPDGTTLEPAAVVNDRIVFRGRCIRHVRRVA